MKRLITILLCCLVSLPAIGAAQEATQEEALEAVQEAVQENEQQLPLI